VALRLMLKRVRVVAGISGQQLCTLEVQPRCIGRTLKAEIERIEGTPWQAQRLLLADSHLALGDSDALPDGEECKLDIKLVRLDPRWLEAVKALAEGKVELEDLDEDIRADKEAVLSAVRVDGHTLAHASEDLRLDRDVVLAAVAENGLALRFAGDALREDMEVALKAIGERGQALKYVGQQLRSCRDVVLAAVRNNGQALEHAGAEFQGDPEVVCAAAKNEPSSFRWAAQP